MAKKLIIIAIMLFSVFGLTSCNLGGNSLADYKAKGIASIDAHISTKTQEDYSTGKWAELLKVAAEGKLAVEDATNKGDVDTAVINAKMAINAIDQESMGEFYTLQEAYDEGWLTIQDLMSIAYYHGTLGGVDGTFIPTPKNPENLNTEVINDIHRTFYAIYVKPFVDEYDIITIDDVEISVYYGTYEDVITIRMKDNFGSAGVIREERIGGITFEYNSGNSIIVWKVS